MHNESSDPLEDEALAWLMRSTSGGFSVSDGRLLEQWLAQSDAHRRAYAEAKRLWQGLGELQESPVIAARMAQAPNSGKAQEQTPHDAIAAEKPITPKPYRIVQARRLSFAVAACLAMLAVFINPDPESLSRWLAEHHTATGEQRTLVLADGSTVYLNSASAVDTDYSPEQRRVELIAGEAEFVVAKDKARPFIVVADGQQIKALGTDFIVKKQGEVISVTVVESAVQVSQPASFDIEPVVLHPGERVDAVYGKQPGKAKTVNAGRARAWRENRLVFEGETLDNVVAEINRYRPGHVFLSDRTLASYRVSGVFHIDRIDKVLAVIDQTLPVKSISLGRRFVLLY